MFYNFKSLEQMHRLFQCVENCKDVAQLPEYHPEGDVFTHLVQTFHIAMRESEDIDLIFAALLHDVGKIVGPHGHADYSLSLLKEHISEKTAWLIKQHMRVNYFLSGEMRKLGKVKALCEHQFFCDLILLSRWDKAGRKAGWKPKYDRVDIIDRLEKFNNA